MITIGILTFFRPVNYGAYLQAYALSHRLNEEEDINAEIIDFHMPVEDEAYNRLNKLNKNISRTVFNRKRFKIFRDALIYQTLSPQKCCTDKIEDFVSFVDGKYDIIIAGSDEIWKIDGYRGFPTPYFLPGELHCTKISYAASGRSPFYKLSQENQDILKNCFDDFSYIGVRDLATLESIKKVVADQNKLHLNFDPSFVYDFHPDAEKGRDLIRRYFHLSGRKKIIAIMYDEKISEKPNFERYLKDNYGKEYDFISLYEWSMVFRHSAQISPMEWVNIIAAADGVISMYFHGICFSIIAGVPFFAIEKRSPNDQESKLHDLLSQLGLLDYYTFGIKNVIDSDKMNPFFDKVNKGMKDDSSSILNKARNDFNDFIDEVRNIYSGENGHSLQEK